MNKSLWQKLQPHAIAIGVFLIISCIYCLPAFKGLVVNQYDAEGWKGMAQQSFEYKEKYGHYPLWTNSTFSGMPTFQIIIGATYNITLAWLHNLFTLWLPEPAGLFFLACIGFYILCISMGVKSRLAILGALAYGFASYNAVIVSVGHTTKFSAMGYAPAVLAGLVLLTQRKYLLGFIVTLIFATQLFWQNHIQIAFYTFLIAIVFAIVLFIRSLKNKELPHFAKVCGLGAVAGIMGFLSYAVVIFPTYTYTKETMRGGRSELTSPGNEKNKSKGGLDKSYAFEYSYGITEVLTMAVPRMYGGSGGEMPENSKTAKTFEEQLGLGEDQAEQYARSMPAYWGPQTNTGGTVYFGAVICLLFVFACVYYKGWHSQWIIAATVMGILLAWGKHFNTLNYFLFDYLPFYNKFRAPSMAMVIPQLTIPLMAVLGLNQVIESPLEKIAFWKKFKQASIISGIFAVMLLGLYFMFDYKGEHDNTLRDNLVSGLTQQLSTTGQPTPEVQQRASEFGRSVISALRDDRKGLFGADLLRSLIYMAITLILLYLFGKGKVNKAILASSLVTLAFIDLIGVDLRYLNSDKYVDREEFEQAFIPTKEDLEIKKDTGYYRVYNASDGGPFSQTPVTARTSYLHNNIAGYHPAKLALYNDLLSQIGRGNMAVLSMLNTKYIILADPATRQPFLKTNPDALGPAWFVSALKYVNNADEEMKALETFSPKDTAIADKREQSKLTYTPQKDSTARIELLEHRNDVMRYKSYSKNNGIAVFSEIYYPYGWTATIDGKETPIARVNYVLRALSIPAGEHTIEFRFEPSSFVWGDRISLIVGIVSILLVLYGAFVLWQDYRKQNIPVEKNKQKA
ncbi:MAG: YfhO family protein [Chitinophagaceae bacterium]|nr:YfhO family protein [Chitinophagaceae bacterium]